MDFEEGLSEEWVEQPVASPTPSNRDESSMQLPPQKSGLQSRIPRPTGPSEIASTKARRSVDLNSSRNGGAPLRLVNTHTSSRSLSSISQGTVQLKQGLGNNEKKATPEWKKRVLQGGNIQGRQQDLFTPVELEIEGVFKPPPASSHSQVSKRTCLSPKKSPKAKATYTRTVFPSSPPVYPASRRALNSQSSDHAEQSVSADTSKRNEEVVTDISHIIPLKDLEESVTIDLMNPNSSSWKAFLAEQHRYVKPVTISPVDLDSVTRSAQRLQEQMDQMGIKEHGRPSSRSSDNGVEYGQDRKPRNGPKVKDLNKSMGNYSIDSLSLAGNAAFVTMERGGHALDSSFLRRPLSPSSFQVPSSGPAQPSTNCQHPQVHDEFEEPLSTTPPPINSNSTVGPRENRSSGSPLKLFDTYDTFTHERLNRRVSQFEGISSIGKSVENSESETSPTPSPSPKRGQEKGFRHEPPPFKENRRISSFGAGELDSYGFDHQQDSRVKSGESEEQGMGQENTTPLPELNRNKHTQFQFQKVSTQTLTNQLTNVQGSYHRTTQLSDAYAMEERENGSTRNHDGKRAWNSPQKRRESKRQRTSGSLPEATIVPQFENQKSRSIAGKKRKDARYDSSSPSADPEVIASRLRLRPKAVHAKSRDSSIGDLIMPGQLDLNHANTHVDTQTEALAEQLAAFAVDVADGTRHGKRIVSVTTGDYLKEANLIMQNIRAKARPQSSQTDQGINHDHLENIEEDEQDDEFSLDTLSRPPSRASKHLKPKLVNPRIVSHLRRYEDQEGSADGFSTSRLSDGNAPEHSEPEESDPPNIRVRERKATNPEAGVDQERGFNSITGSPAKTHGSNVSSGVQSGCSVPTNSTGSESVKRRTIAPDKVSHLISENMGKMTFDTRQKIWVKRRTVTDTLGQDRIDSDMTEEDALRGIPDLTVDESQEYKHLRPSTASTRPVSSNADVPNDTKIIDAAASQARPSSSGTVETGMTKNSQWASSGPAIETRATSWGDQNLQMPKLPTMAPILHDSRQEEETQEYEIEVSQTPTGTPTKGPSRHQARVVTVAFSSPLTQTAEPTRVWEDGSVLDLSSPCGTRTPVNQSMPLKNRAVDILRSSSRRLSRRFSNGSRSRNFTPRPVSRIDEHDELSFLANDATALTELVLALSTPPPPDISRGLTVPHTNIKDPSSGFKLSTLPDFTIHNDLADKSVNLDVDYLAEKFSLRTQKEIEDRFVLAIQQLVLKLNDIEPFNPHWEYMRKLDLGKAELSTLHMLDELCPRIEELDVNRCRLNQLNGAPSSLRDLNVPSNKLSSITSWAHLPNLQYLNAGGNSIADLKGFTCLIHLRALYLSYNECVTLEGIERLNGLLKLVIGWNLIEHLNVDNFDLTRLTNLDAYGNKIRIVTGLGQLSSLERLNLGLNHLSAFPIDRSALPHSLKKLNLSMNHLTHLDVTHAPMLEDINIDGNHISVMRGIERLKKLNSVSWRLQTTRENENASIELDYRSCSEARSLYLSRNRIEIFSPGLLFPNLHRLELADCKIESLAEDFGCKMPNLRFLNLNRNSIKTLDPLLGIRALEELYIAENRIERLRRTMNVLGKFRRTLTKLDMIDNPLTHGFYTHHELNEEPQFPYLHGHDYNTEKIFLHQLMEEETNEACKHRLSDTTFRLKEVYETLIFTKCPRLVELDAMPLRHRLAVDRTELMTKLIGLGVLSISVEREECVVASAPPSPPSTVWAAPRSCEKSTEKSAWETKKRVLPASAETVHSEKETEHVPRGASLSKAELAEHETFPEYVEPATGSAPCAREDDISRGSDIGVKVVSKDKEVWKGR